MIKHNQDGVISAIAVSLILCSVLLVAAIGFGGWAYSSRLDYKNNSDQKSAAAVAVAKQQLSSQKDKEFAEKEKLPYRVYNGPSSYGSVAMQYPKTWSGVVATSDDNSSAGNSNALVDGYFYPNVVPSITDQDSTFAVRLQILNKTYSDTLKDLSELQQNEDNPTSISPYSLPQLPNIVGVQTTGGLPNQKTGTMVVLPLRSQTLEVWTEGNQFTNDYNNTILANLTFIP